MVLEVCINFITNITTMKRVYLGIAFLLLVGGFMSACGDYYYIDPYGNSKEPLVVSFWTNGEQVLDVYVDGSRYGTLRKALAEEPECGAFGSLQFFSVDRGSKHVVYAVTQDGTVLWPEKTIRMNRSCLRMLFTQTESGQPKVTVN